MEQSMHEKNTELIESLHQFKAIWNMIGKPFLQVDDSQTGRKWRSGECEASYPYTAPRGIQPEWYYYESDLDRWGEHIGQTIRASLVHSRRSPRGIFSKHRCS
jgi:hypothetical protein